MLQSFDYLDEVLATQHRHEANTLPEYYASELLEALGNQPDQAASAGPGNEGMRCFRYARSFKFQKNLLLQSRPDE